MKISPISFTSNNRYYERTSADNKVKNTSCFTCMFRDDIPWRKFIDYLQEHFKDSKQVDIISHACSDGSEPFSLAIMLHELLGTDKAEKFMPVHAYDYDAKIMSYAKNGIMHFNRTDYALFREANIDLYNYFRYENYDRCLAMNSYSISPKLQNDVVFENESILDTLQKIPDNKQNCVLLCRNMYPYLSFYEMDKFRKLLCQKLGTGSVVVFGDYDIQNFGKIIISDLLSSGFSYALPMSDCIFVRNFSH